MCRISRYCVYPQQLTALTTAYYYTADTVSVLRSPLHACTTPYYTACTATCSVQVQQHHIHTLHCQQQIPTPSYTYTSRDHHVLTAGSVCILFVGQRYCAYSYTSMDTPVSVVEYTQQVSSSQYIYYMQLDVATALAIHTTSSIASYLTTYTVCGIGTTVALTTLPSTVMYMYCQHVVVWTLYTSSITTYRSKYLPQHTSLAERSCLTTGSVLYLCQTRCTVLLTSICILHVVWEHSEVSTHCIYLPVERLVVAPAILTTSSVASCLTTYTVLVQLVHLPYTVMLVVVWISYSYSWLELRACLWDSIADYLMQWKDPQQ